MTILARARTACAIALIAGAAILATAASYGQDSPEKTCAAIWHRRRCQSHAYKNGFRPESG